MRSLATSTVPYGPCRVYQPAPHIPVGREGRWRESSRLDSNHWLGARATKRAVLSRSEGKKGLGVLSPSGEFYDRARSFYETRSYFQRPQWTPVKVTTGPLASAAPLLLRTQQSAMFVAADARKNIFLRIGLPSFSVSLVASPLKVP